MGDDIKNLIKEITNTLDIVDIIGSCVETKKAGREYHALCPFHNEKTPSFTISPQKQFYYCFGCHAKGDLITFTMQYYSLNFIDAVEKLATQAGLSMPKTFNNQPEIDKNLYKTMRDMAIKAKLDLQQNKFAQKYLEQRSIPDKILKLYHVGYSGENTLEWIKNKINTKDYSLLNQCGLLATREDGSQKAKFYNRILFPIQDNKGKVIAFGGRAIKEKAQPKYLNSPETILFQKRQTLYGLYQFRQSNASQVYIVEGYMDVLALAAQGIPNAVACLGTAFTEKHWHGICRFAKKVIFCFDGDRAGKKAAWTSLLNILPKLKPENKVYFMFLKQGEDPDTFIKNNGKDKFIHESTKSKTWDKFYIQQLQELFNIENVSEKASCIVLSKSHLESMQNIALREALQQEVDKLTQRNTQFKKNKEQNLNHNNNNTKNEQVKNIISAIINQIANKPATKWSYKKTIENPGHSQSIYLINTWLEEINSNPLQTGAKLQEKIQGTNFYPIFAHYTSNKESENFSPEITTGLLHDLRYKIIDNQIKKLLQENSRNNYTDTSKKLIQDLIYEKKKIQQDKINILNSETT